MHIIEYVAVVQRATLRVASRGQEVHRQRFDVFLYYGLYDYELDTTTHTNIHARM